MAYNSNSFFLKTFIAVKTYFIKKNFSSDTYIREFKKIFQK